jgi:hypothetical protein
MMNNSLPSRHGSLGAVVDRIPYRFELAAAYGNGPPRYDLVQLQVYRLAHSRSNRRSPPPPFPDRSSRVPLHHGRHPNRLRSRSPQSAAQVQRPWFCFGGYAVAMAEVFAARGINWRVGSSCGANHVRRRIPMTNWLGRCPEDAQRSQFASLELETMLSRRATAAKLLKTARPRRALEHDPKSLNQKNIPTHRVL